MKVTLIKNLKLNIKEDFLKMQPDYGSLCLKKEITDLRPVAFSFFITWLH